MKRDFFFVIGTSAHSLVNFRFNLLKELSKKYNVVAISKNRDSFIKNKLKKKRISFLHYGSPSKFFLWSEICSLVNLLIILSKYHNNFYIISYTFRGNIFSGLASFIFRKIKHIPMITGLGSIYLSRNNNWQSNIVYVIFFRILAFFLEQSKAVIFLNKDDKNYFYKKGYLKNKKLLITNGSGVNLSIFKPLKLNNKIIFLMISRIVKYKGILNYLDASKELKQKYPNIQFYFAGDFYQSPYSINKNYFLKKIKNCNVKYLSFSQNVKKFFKISSIFVLPSEREGVPRSALEAMACGRGIVVPNVAGCKEVVVNNYNGFLMKNNSKNELVKSLEKIIVNKKLIKKFGKNSIKLSSNFCVNKLNKKIINFLSKI